MANQKDNLSQIDRRDFLRFLSGGALALAGGSLLAGCGGNSQTGGNLGLGNHSLTDNPSCLLTRSRQPVRVSTLPTQPGTLG